MPGLDPGIHVFPWSRQRVVAGAFGTKTRFALWPGHDGEKSGTAPI